MANRFYGKNIPYTAKYENAMKNFELNTVHGARGLSSSQKWLARIVENTRAYIVNGVNRFEALDAYGYHYEVCSGGCNILVDNHVMMCVLDRGYNYFYAGDGVIRKHHLIYFMSHPDKFQSFLEDSRLVVNHMVCKDAVALGIEGQRCYPWSRWETPETLELIPQSVNAIHGRFYSMLGLYGYRLPAEYIPCVEKWLFKHFKHTVLGTFLVNKDYEGFYNNVKLTANEKEVMFREIYESLGDTTPYYYGGV